MFDEFKKGFANAFGAYTGVAAFTAAGVIGLQLLKKKKPELFEPNVDSKEEDEASE